MSLTLDFNGQLLIGDIGDVDVHLANGSKLPVTVARKPERRVPRTIPDTEKADTLGFFVEIRFLPSVLQTHIRDSINKEQQKIHDANPTYVDEPHRVRKPHPKSYSYRLAVPFGHEIATSTDTKQVPLENPPTTVEIPRNYPLAIKVNNTWNGHPCLRIGEKLDVRPLGQFKGLQFTLGIITGFTIRPPH